VDPDVVRVDLGWIGHAEVPVPLIERISVMHWPWWGGVGARIGRGRLVGFIGAPGPAVVIDLAEPLDVRAPFRWSARRVAVGADDVAGLAAAVAAAREASPGP
jgi:hypothetical protein